MPLSLGEKDMYPPELLAKRLNNRASFLISTCVYEEGISLLKKALKLSPRNLTSDNKQNNKIPCSCNCCSLEAYFLTDQDSFLRMMDREKEVHNHNKKNYTKKKCTMTKRNKDLHDNDEEMMEFDHVPHQHHNNNQIEHNEISPLHQHQHMHHQLAQHSSASSSYLSSQKEFRSPTSEKEPNDGFIYSRPLFVNQHSIEEGHFMGTTLSLIILFNLSLAHHLLAIAELKKEKDDMNNGGISRLRAQQALQLYELVYQQHKLNTNTTTTTTTNNNNNNENNEYNRSIGSLKFLMVVSNNIGEIHRLVGNLITCEKFLQHLLSLIMCLVDNDIVLLDSIEMEGFYHNVSRIMMKDICAQAA